MRRPSYWFCHSCGKRQLVTAMATARGNQPACRLCGMELSQKPRPKKYVRIGSKDGKGCCVRCGSSMRRTNVLMGFCSSMECKATRDSFVNFLRKKSFAESIKDVVVTSIKEVSHGGGYLFSGELILENKQKVMADCEYVPGEKL